MGRRHGESVFRQIIRLLWTRVKLMVTTGPRERPDVLALILLIAALLVTLVYLYGYVAGY